MAPTTITSIVMALIAIGVLTLSGYTWFGSWQPEVRRVPVEDDGEIDVELAVLQMRQAIEEYEQGHRRP